MSAAPAAAGRRLPLFLRIFAVMLAAVIGAQLLDLGLLLLAPPPPPHLFPISEVARVLAGAAPPAELSVSDEAAPPSAGDHAGHAERLREDLARRMGVAPERLRVSLARPPLFAPGIEHRFHGPRAGPPPEGHEGVLFGLFRVAIAEPGGRWRTVRPTHGYDPWRGRLLLWLLCSLLAVAPFAWLISRRLAKPIGLFAEAAEAIGRDPRGPPLPLDGPPEVAAAAAVFNQMQARIGRYVEDRVTMVAAIAHDLRTPLMRLALRVEEAPAAARAAMEADIADMTAMISAALAFVRDTQAPGRRQRLSLRALAESVAEGMADLGQDVTLLPGGEVVVEADLAALKALIANLIGNAVKYAGAARVRIGRDGADALIEVEDDGPGVPEEELEQVFAPFYRVERSRSRETGGAGLGLASVRAVARSHGGEARLANRPGGGLLATVRLPLARPR